MSVYAGESLAKKVARVRLYRRTREMLRCRNIDPATIKVVFLPGPEAAEVGALKYIFKARAQNVVGIDRDEVAIEALRKKWPGACGILGDLADRSLVEDEAGPFRRVFSTFQSPHDLAGFIHLDLMGNLSVAAALMYCNWAAFCREDGVVAVTYLRGRERIKIPTEASNFEVARGLAKAAVVVDKPIEAFRICARGVQTCFDKVTRRLVAPDPERATSHLIALCETGYCHQVQRKLINDAVQRGVPSITRGQLGEATARALDALMAPGVFERSMHAGELKFFSPIASYAYRAEVSPMGILAAQYVRKPTQQLASYQHAVGQRSRHASSIIRKDPMDDLLAEADSLQKEFSREQVAEILNVSTGTLAAWRAHRTLGTYAEA